MLILTSHLHLVLPNDLFSLGLATEFWGRKIRMSLLPYQRQTLFYNLPENGTLSTHGKGPGNLASEWIIGLNLDGKEKKNSVSISYFSHVCMMSSTLHPPEFSHPN
jgi:hypothetical protein